MPTATTTAVKPARASRASRGALEAPKKDVAAAERDAGVKIPKTLAACADMLYEMERKRYAIQRQVDDMKKVERALREHLIRNLPKSDALGVTGKIANATIKDQEIVTLTGTETDRFALVYDYILRNARRDPGVWSLLQRRLGDASAKELIAAGKGDKIGAKIETVPVVSLRKVS